MWGEVVDANRTGINITTGAVLGLSSSGGFGFLVNDEACTRTALEAAGIMAREVDLFSVSVPDEPAPWRTLPSASQTPPSTSSSSSRRA